MIVLADGAHWIWNLVEDLIPHAVQILDFSHAKHYLWEAAKLIYGADSPFVRPWVKEREALLFADQVEQVIAHLQRFVNLAPGHSLHPSLLPTPPDADALRHVSATGLFHWLGGH